MSIRLMAAVWHGAPYKETNLLVLLALADYANDDGYCWPTTRQIAEKARLDPRNVQRHIETYRRDGYLQRIARPGRASLTRLLVPGSWYYVPPDGSPPPAPLDDDPGPDPSSSPQNDPQSPTPGASATPTPGASAAPPWRQRRDPPGASAVTPPAPAPPDPLSDPSSESSLDPSGDPSPRPARVSTSPTKITRTEAERLRAERQREEAQRSREAADRREAELRDRFRRQMEDLTLRYTTPKAV